MSISSYITCMYGSCSIFWIFIKILSFGIDFFLNHEAYVFLSFLFVCSILNYFLIFLFIKKNHVLVFCTLSDIDGESHNDTFFFFFR